MSLSGKLAGKPQKYTEKAQVCSTNTRFGLGKFRVSVLFNVQAVSGHSPLSVPYWHSWV